MRFRLLIHRVLIAAVVVFTAQTSFGQQYPPLSKRQQIVAALNNAVGLGGQPTVPAVELYDALDNGCAIVDPLNVEIIYHDNHFVLRRKLRNGVQQAPPTRHPLVDDLNAWLNGVWAMDLTHVLEFDDLGWQCSNSGQRYYTRSTTDADAVEAVMELSGENRILNKYYMMDGELQKGSGFMFFEADSSVPRVVKYITDLGNGSSEHKQRLLGAAFLVLECWKDGNLYGSPLIFKFDFETERYTSDCGEPRVHPYNITVWKTYFDSCEVILTSDPQLPDDRNRELFDTLNDQRGRWQSAVETQRDPVSGKVPQLGHFTIDNAGFLTFVIHRGYLCDTAVHTLCKLGSGMQEDEYCETSYCNGGTFELDDYGQIIYTMPANSTCGDGCTSLPVPCIEFCDSIPITPPTITGVIQTDARTFSDRSPLIPEEEFYTWYPRDEPNEFEKGERGKWRVAKEYVYRTTTATKPGSAQFSNSQPSERNYNDAGVFNLNLFSWRNTNNDAPWLNATRVTRYSQNGEAVEEEDAFGIPSSARFGYNQQVPILVAKNATYNSTFFQSFEADVEDVSTGNGDVVTTAAHAGKSSYSVPPGSWSEEFEKHLEIDAMGAQDGLLVRVWTKHNYPSQPPFFEKVCPIALKLKAAVGGITLNSSDFTFVAKTGEWSLFEALIPSPTQQTYRIEVKGESNLTTIWMDDLRIQPQSSEMVCYVYDPATLRTVAMFDDQHFGIYYQYNGEGKLVRNIRETMRGFKTVQETQYHAPTIDRDYASSNVTGTRSADQRDMLTTVSPVLGEARQTDTGGMGGKFDLFSLELGVERRTVKVFGTDVDKLGEKVEEIKGLLEFPSLERLQIPAVEKLRLLDDLMKLDSTVRALSEIDTEALDEGERIAVENARLEAIRLRAELLQRMGINEAEARELLDAALSVKESIEEESEPTEQSESSKE